MIPAVHDSLHQASDSDALAKQPPNFHRAYAVEANATLTADQLHHPALTYTHHGSLLLRVYPTQWGPLAVPIRLTPSHRFTLVDLDAGNIAASCRSCRKTVPVASREELRITLADARRGGPTTIPVS